MAAVHGKHVAIQYPNRLGSVYRNYKGTFSTVLPALVGAFYRFWWVSGSAGREGDSAIFTASDIGQALASGNIQLPPAKEDLGPSCSRVSRDLPCRTRILYSNYRQLGFFNQFGEFSSLAKFVSGSQEVASPIRLSCQVRAALFNNKGSGECTIVGYIPNI